MDNTTAFKLTPTSFLSLLKTTNFYILALMPLWLVFGVTLTDVAIGILIASFIYYMVTAQDYSFLSKPFVKVALIFWLYISVQGFILTGTAAFKTDVAWIRFFLLLGPASWVIDSPQALKKFFIIVAAIIFFVIIDTFIQYIYRVDLFGFQTIASAEYHRLTGPLRKPRVGSYLLLFLFPLFLYTLQEKKIKIAGLFLFALSLVIIILSGERMTLLLAFFGLFILIFIQKKLRKPLVILFSLGVLSLPLFILSNAEIKNRFITVTSNIFTTNGGYKHLYVVGARIFTEKPLFGWGANQFSVACKLPQFFYHNHIDYQCGHHPHNIYLQLLIDKGIVGFGLFMWLLFSITRYSYKHFHESALGFALTAFLFLWPIGGMRNFFITFGSTLIWFSIALCYAIIQYNKERERNHVEH